MQHGFVEAAGRNLEYRLIPAHQLNRPTLVFLHEGLGSLAMWRDFPAKVAAATGCRTLVYSRYGYGESDVLTEAFGVRYMHDEALVALPELLDKLGIDKPVLVGHSDGGSIALIHAGGAGRNVAGLILMAPHVFVEDISIASIAQAKVAFETTDLGAEARQVPSRSRQDFLGLERHLAAPRLPRLEHRGSPAARHLPGVAIQGEDDEYGTPAQVEAIRRQAKGEVEVLMLADCRHSPHKDQPQATLEAMAGFIERIG